MDKSDDLKVPKTPTKFRRESNKKMRLKYKSNDKFFHRKGYKRCLKNKKVQKFRKLKPRRKKSDKDEMKFSQYRKIKKVKFQRSNEEMDKNHLLNDMAFRAGSKNENIKEALDSKLGLKSKKFFKKVNGENVQKWRPETEIHEEKFKQENKSKSVNLKKDEDTLKDEIIKNQNFDQFYKKCQENAQKWMKNKYPEESAGGSYEFEEKEKERKKAKYFQKTQDWEVHMKWLKNALREAYVIENVDQKSPSDAEDSEEMLRQVALLSLNKNPKSLPQNKTDSNPKEITDDEINKEVRRANFLSSLASRMLKIEPQSSPQKSKTNPKKKFFPNFKPHQRFIRKKRFIAPPVQRLVFNVGDSSSDGSSTSSDIFQENSEDEKGERNNCDIITPSLKQAETSTSIFPSNNHFLMHEGIKLNTQQQEFLPIKNKIPKNKELDVKMEEIKEERGKTEKPRDSVEGSITSKLEKRCHYNEELREYENLVEKVEKEFEEYLEMKEKAERLQKEFFHMRKKMLSRKRLLVMTKESIQEKNELISSKLSKIPKYSEEHENRNYTLLAFKLREATLMSQIALRKLHKEIPDIATDIDQEESFQPPRM